MRRTKKMNEGKSGFMKTSEPSHEDQNTQKAHEKLHWKASRHLNSC